MSWASTVMPSVNSTFQWQSKIQSVFRQNLGESSRINFLGHFWPLLMVATIFGVARSLTDIGLSLKSNHHSQFKQAPISDAYGRKDWGIECERSCDTWTLLRKCNNLHPMQKPLRFVELGNKEKLNFKFNEEIFVFI